MTLDKHLPEDFDRPTGGPADPTYLWKKRLGTWRQTIKQSNEKGAAVYDQDDMASHESALRGTGQNLCIHGINSLEDYENFLALLQEVRYTGINVIAAMRSPNVSNNEIIWFPKNDSWRLWDPGDPDLEQFPIADITAAKGPTVIGDAVPSAPEFSGDHGEYYRLQREYIAKWVEAWSCAAKLLSGLSLKYENLVGFTIDDFFDPQDPGLPTCLFGERLNHDEVAEIYGAAHAWNQDFNFLPTCGWTSLGRFAGRGYVLGANYGVTLHPEYGKKAADVMSVRLAFTISEAPISAYLTFFHSTTSIEGGAAVKKEVLVNATSVWDEDCTVNGSVQKFSKEVSSLLLVDDPAENVKLLNTIELKLHAPSAAYDVHGTHLFWRILTPSLSTLTVQTQKGETADLGDDSRNNFDPDTIRDRLELIGLDPKLGKGVYGLNLPELGLVLFEKVSFTESFYVSPRIESYAADYSGRGFDKGTDGDKSTYISNTDVRGLTDGTDDECADLANNPNDGYAATRLVAAPNDDFLIHDVIDGLIPYVGGTLSSVPNDALAPDQYYGDLLRHTTTMLPDLDILPCHWAFKPGSECDPLIVRDRIELAADILDTAILWNYPIGVYYIDASDRRGVFAENVSDDALYSLLLFWPSRQAALPGWYQQFTTTTGLKGKDIVIKMRDTRGIDSSSENRLERFIAIETSSGLVEESYDVASDGSAMITAGPYTVVGAVTVGARLGDAGVQDFGVKVYFEIEDTSGAPLTPLWAYESGIDPPKDVDVIETFSEIADAFARIRLEE